MTVYGTVTTWTLSKF